MKFIAQKFNLKSSPHNKKKSALLISSKIVKMFALFTFVLLILTATFNTEDIEKHEHTQEIRDQINLIKYRSETSNTRDLLDDMKDFKVGGHTSANDVKSPHQDIEKEVAVAKHKSFEDDGRESTDKSDDDASGKRSTVGWDSDSTCTYRNSYEMRKFVYKKHVFYYRVPIVVKECFINYRGKRHKNIPMETNSLL